MASRTTNSLRNLRYGLAGQFLSLIVGFVARSVFVHTLSAEYLGINGLFANILTVLSVAELGIGSAIVYSMYQPLAQRDEGRLLSLMGVYRKAYIAIGVAVAFAGTLILPFLPLIVREMPSIPNLQAIYLLFVANSSITYFFSYKRAFLIADQKRYITSIYRYGFFLALNAVQIFILVAFGDYLLFLLAQVAFTFAENVAVSRRVDRMYPFLRARPAPPLSSSDRQTIIQNVKALVLLRVSGAVRGGIDSVLISALAGVVAVGIYSNYLLITSALSVVFGVAFSSVTASVGNLNALGPVQKRMETFRAVDTAVYLAHSSAAVSLFVLFNPFIALWLGREYLFDETVVAAIVINFYLVGMRNSLWVFKDAMGLYWKDRFRPLPELFVGLLGSVFLGQHFGVLGVLGGGILSLLLVSLPLEPLVLFRYGLESPVRPYYLEYLMRLLLTLLAGSLTWALSRQVSAQGWSGFIVSVLACLLIPNLLNVSVFWRSVGFRRLLSLVSQS
ncbi:lipopolysaccharide biosynthesis protein [Aestuariimicrobium sp. Y1814]|uniref:lipopolysaccharide biosynthesis protein n=1 Tax=Aestuariimicrobium sp. Y1814 TaxID=3418742 RepID=UPI003DA77735